MTTPVCKWDKEKMRALYERNPVAKALLDNLATPTNALNNPKEGFFQMQTTVEDAVTAIKCVRLQAIEVLKEFANLGCGRFLTGRRGQQSRLQWNLHPDSIAAEVVRPLTTASPTGPGGADNVVEQLIWLRPGVQVAVRFPQDMTQEEAERVAGVVRNLWLSPRTLKS